MAEFSCHFAPFLRPYPRVMIIHVLRDLKREPAYIKLGISRHVHDMRDGRFFFTY